MSIIIIALLILLLREEEMEYANRAAIARELQRAIPSPPGDLHILLHQDTLQE